MAVLFAALVCFATGFGVVSLGWPRGAGIRSHFVLKASLATGFGLGFFSLLFFLGLLLGLSRTELIVSDIALCGVLAFLVWKRRLSGTVSTYSDPTSSSSSLDKLLAWAFGLLLLMSLYISVKLLIAYPHGTGWDAFAIWNLRARFLFLGGPQWRDGFSSLLPWSHPDYPLLLSAAIAHFWSYLGRDSVTVPAVIAFVFMFATVGLLVPAVSALCGRVQGFLAGIALLGTPYFLERGVSQYADTALGFFFLATLALLCLHDNFAESDAFLGLAGSAAGFAAWTKNEGLFFVTLVVVSRFIALHASGRLRKHLRQMVPLLAGALPILLVVAYFKVYVAGPGDLLSPPSAVIHRLTDPGRYWMILRYFTDQIYEFGGWVLIPGPILAGVYALLLGTKVDPKLKAGVATSILAICLTVAGYFVIYLITPLDLPWHLVHSLSRLLTQLLPSAIFAFFMIVRAPDQLRERQAF